MTTRKIGSIIETMNKNLRTLHERSNELERELILAETALSKYEPDPEEHWELFDDYIDGVWGNIQIMGINYSASLALKRTDIVRYTEKLNNYIADEFSNNPRIFPDYVELEQTLSDIQTEIDMIAMIVTFCRKHGYELE